MHKRAKERLRAARGTNDEEFIERLRRRSREGQRRWKERHPEDVKRLNANRDPDHVARRRARLRGQFVERVDRFRAWLLGGGRCGICDGHVAFEAMHLDHIVPISRGGLHAYDNVQPAHPRCNQRKSAKCPS